MISNQNAIVKDLVLVGGGHSHAIVLKKFAMKPLPGVRLTVISRDVHTPYSGMLPGYLAGHYDFDEVHIDLRPLCQSAGARLYHDEAVRIDHPTNQVVCKGRPSVPYDVLSINIGSTPSFNGIPNAEEFTTPVKPISNFIDRWQIVLKRTMEKPRTHRIGVVGAGAGGIELLLAAQYRLDKLLADRDQSSDGIEFHLIFKSETILPEFNRTVRKRFEHYLKARCVQIHAGALAMEIASDGVIVAGGKKIELDEIFWVTEAGAPRWLWDSGLDLDETGFIRVRDTLQTTSHDNIFATGDIATIVNHPRPKAGVFAVRQGSPLNDNLRLILTSNSAKSFSPQKAFLSLISTGDKNAVASKWGWTIAGPFVWHWKNWIDRRFMRKFSELPVMVAEKAKR